MRYTLEIQKLLLQTQNDSLHPREKANLLKEAIRIADENEDVEWATELRLDASVDRRIGRQYGIAGLCRRSGLLGKPDNTGSKNDARNTK